jgi:soluble lytic murein transglycosylase-like protein
VVGLMALSPHGSTAVARNAAQSAPGHGSSAFPASASAFARQDLPASYIGLYVQSGRRYGLSGAILAAVGRVESDHGQSPLPGVSTGANGAGAGGPAQFLPGTWQRYGMDADGHGTANRYDPADAIPAMAAYLRASGAPESWHHALFTYNHSASYVRAVLGLSRRYDPSATA